MAGETYACEGPSRANAVSGTGTVVGGWEEIPEVGGFRVGSIWQGNALASNLVMRSIPDRPSMSPCHVASFPMPSGEIMPRPVMTTLRFIKED